jgi:hypothetical protein
MRWQPGTWMRWIFGPSGITGAIVICPQCGAGMSIGGGRPFGSVHTIATDGTISPSVVCHSCAWHVFARLIGWPTRTEGSVAC